MQQALPLFLSQVCCHSKSEFCHPLDIILRQFISFLPAVLKSLEMAPLQKGAKRVFSSAEERRQRLLNGSCNLCGLWGGGCLQGAPLPQSLVYVHPNSGSLTDWASPSPLLQIKAFCRWHNSVPEWRVKCFCFFNQLSFPYIALDPI